jgi:hypothetical protein
MKQEELNDVQFRILDAVYFVEPLSHILEDVGGPASIVLDELRQMIDKGWIQVMEYDAARRDYVRTPFYDSDHLEEYHFLATKAGLLKHNGHS